MGKALSKAIGPSHAQFDTYGSLLYTTKKALAIALTRAFIIIS